MFGFGEAKATTTKPSSNEMMSPLGSASGGDKVQTLKSQIRQELSVQQAQELVQVLFIGVIV